MKETNQNNAAKELEKDIQLLLSNNLNVSTPLLNDYHFDVTVRNETEKVKYLIYFGKKGIKKVIQGNKESALYKKLNSILFDKDLFVNIVTQETEFDEYIGTDESGKGDYFGPLVTAAVYTNKNINAEFIKTGVKDSKLLSDNDIKKIEPVIKKIVSGRFDIVIINPEKYNLLYEKFKNLNKLLAWAHSKAIENLVVNVNCNNVISDKFGNELLINSELSKKNIEVNIFQTTKGERFPGVAAASILARAKVIDWFKLKSKELGFDIPKGAGEQVNFIADKILQKANKEYLLKMIKFHFKNSQNIFTK